MGKVVQVEIGKIPTSTNGNVYDVNGNSLKSNVKIEKTLANLNLDKASASFTVTLNNINCVDANISHSEDVKSKIASVLESDISRVEIGSVDCHDGNAVLKVRILPPGDRRMLNSPGHVERSLDLFNNLKDISEGKQGRAES